MKKTHNGYLLYNKPPGLTSFESLGKIKKLYETKKAGHTGTLDKFASGLLLVLLGRGTRLAPLFVNCTKEYRGTIFFGEETDTLDPEGEVIARGELPSRQALEGAMENFRGEILQAPPAYSAIHINGRRAHELAREGKGPVMEKRPVTIYDLELISWEPPLAEIRALVSSGTYIRSLARDIALAAGSRAHLAALKRSALGPFGLDEASGDFASADAAPLAGASNLRQIDEALFKALSLPVFYIEDRAAFVHGKALEGILNKEDLSLSGAEAAGVFGNKGPHDFLGFLEQRKGKWAYGYVYANN